MTDTQPPVEKIDAKTLKVLWAALNVIRQYFPVESNIHQMLIDPLNEIQKEWENNDRTPKIQMEQ